MPTATSTRKSDRTRSKSPARSKSRSRSRSRSRGRSKSPARTKAKASPSPARRSPGRTTRAKSTTKTPSTPTRASARIAQKEQEKEQKVEEDTKVKEAPKSPKKEVKEPSSTAKFIHGIGSPLFATIAILLMPWMALAFNMACTKSSCSYKNLCNMPKDLNTYFNRDAFGVFFAFSLVQVILYFLPVGKTVQGYPNSKGKTLAYRCNGIVALLLTLLGIGVSAYMKVSFAFALEHFIHFIVAGTLLSFVVSVYLHFKAGTAAAHELSEDGQTGCLPLDFYLGKEVNPRLGSFDFKHFVMKFSLVTWAALTVIIVLQSQVAGGSCNLTLVAVAACQLFYIADLLWFESTMFGSLDFTREGTGFQVAFGGMVFIPFVYCLQARFLMDHPHPWSYAMLAVFLVMFLVGYVIMRGSNSQKDHFRRNPNDPALSHLETIPSPSGKKLLASGWWGLVRHPNYLGDIIMSLAWTLPCGFDHILPYIYPFVLIALLLHRVSQDNASCRAKHGAAWDRYCQRVKYRIIPYIY